MQLIQTILVTFFAGMGAGLGTGFAGLSAAAVISPMLITFLGIDPYMAVGIALSSDVLASAASAYTYKKNKENCEKQYAFRVKKYEMQIEQEKARLVNGLIKDLKTWLSNAEQFSNDVLVSFGIQ